MRPKDDPDTRAVEDEAAAWLLRNDRGLTADEDGELRRWLAADPRHRAAFDRYRHNWAALDQLVDLRPALSSQPNPDLFAPHSKRMGWTLVVSLAAATCMAVAIYTHTPPQSADVFRDAMQPSHSTAPIEERTLEDGTKIELDRGANVTVRYTPAERFVHLDRGEAHFNVAKNPSRPFIVDAGGVRVRAVGTAFDVRLVPTAVVVLVTEGKVQVNVHLSRSDSEAPPRGAEPRAIAQATNYLEAGQRAFVALATENSYSRVTRVSHDDIERLLSWEPRDMAFTDTPLTDVLTQFNYRNPVKLRAADSDLATLRISGSFRSDNIEGFVRLLEVSFGVKARRNFDEVVLYKAR